MKRRGFVAAAGVVATAGLSGCTDLLDDGPPERPWPPGDPIEDPGGAHHLFVENHTDATEAAWLRVVREDGVALVDGRYELPDGRAIQFEDVAAWETSYTIDLAIDGEDAVALEWFTEECGPDSEAPGDSGSRNAAVRVEAADGGDGYRVDLRVDACDAIVAGSLPAGPASAFRLDE